MPSQAPHTRSLSRAVAYLRPPRGTHRRLRPALCATRRPRSREDGLLRPSATHPRGGSLTRHNTPSAHARPAHRTPGFPFRSGDRVQNHHHHQAERIQQRQPRSRNFWQRRATTPASSIPQSRRTSDQREPTGTVKPSRDHRTPLTSSFTRPNFTSTGDSCGSSSATTRAQTTRPTNRPSAASRTP